MKKVRREEITEFELTTWDVQRALDKALREKDPDIPKGASFKLNINFDNLIGTYTMRIVGPSDLKDGILKNVA